MTQHIRILVVAPRGRLSEGLRVLLRAGRHIEFAGQAEDGATALRMVAEGSPGLVLLSTNLPGSQAWSLLRQLRQRWPEVHCCVIAQNSAEERRAIQEGAHTVLLTGFAAEDLYSTIAVTQTWP